MKLVIALGGNALLKRQQPLEESLQRLNIAEACDAIAQVAQDHDLVITHGNGPQIGLLALQNDAYHEVTPYSLDVLGAETEGMVGYLLMQALSNALPHKNVATLLTRTEVLEDDPAFDNPTKFIGPVYSDEAAKRLEEEKGWTMKRDGDKMRRVVASPEPQAIVEQEAINHLLKKENLLLVCGGGGGIPVMRDKKTLRRKGVEAVVDKDAASMVLASVINADGLIMLTDVGAVETNFSMPDSKRLKRLSPQALRGYNFPAGSMGPKIKAACDFANQPNRFAAIGALSDLSKIVEQKAGTRVDMAADKIEFYS